MTDLNNWGYFREVKKPFLLPELQIKVDIWDNSKIFVLFFNEIISCDLSLELSRRDGSDDGSQHTF